MEKKKLSKPVLTILVADIWPNGFFLCACGSSSPSLARDPNCSKHKSPLSQNFGFSFKNSKNKERKKRKLTL